MRDGVAAGVGRILLIDWARTIALVAMAIFHFGIDLELVGHWPRGTTQAPHWIWSARAIAGSFVFLAGLSLWLGHGVGIKWRSFLRRLAILVAAACVVSLATYVTTPQGWVRFGILHSIALSSVAGLAVLRLPAAVTAVIAVAILWFGPGLETEALNGAAWLWLGLGTQTPFMMDYEPFIPWVAPFLLGIAAGRLGSGLGLWERLASGARARGRLGRWLAWPGQNSLLVYLIHQPILLGGILGFTWLFA